MPIAQPGNTPDKAIFYTDSYKTLVRSQKEILLRQAAAVPIVKRNELYSYRNDIYRLLRSLNVDPHMYWTVAYLNGIENPDQDISHLQVVFTIEASVLQRALARSNTAQG